MRRCNFFISFAFTLLLILVNNCLVSSEEVKTKTGYGDSFAFVEVRNNRAPKLKQRFCVNFQQYLVNKLPATVGDAEPLKISWWRDRNELDVCNPTEKHFSPSDIVPSLYRTNASGSHCQNASEIFRHYLIPYQITIMKRQNVSQILFLVEKGKRNYYGFRDYLFRQFSNPEIKSTDINVFYMYNDIFFNEIMDHIPEDLESHTELRFYRPESKVFLDFSVFVLWFLAVSCIFFGSLWGAYDARISLNHSSSEQRRLNSETNDVEEVSAERVEATLESSVNIIDLFKKLSPEVAVESFQENAGVAAVANVSVVPIPEPIITIETEQTTETPSVVGLTNTETESNRQLFAGTSSSPSKSKKVDPNLLLAQMSALFHCVYVLFFIAFVAGILLLAFFFRDKAVIFFNIFLVCLGTMSVHNCVYGVLQLCFSCFWVNALHRDFDVELFSFSQIFCIDKYRNAKLLKPEESDPEHNRIPTFSSSPSLYWRRKLARWSVCSTKLQLLSLLVFCGSAALCVTWYLHRENPYSFVMLDFINACLCINAIRTSMCRSLRFLTFLLLGMFCYDMFMVFGTRLLTSSGCSVMVQVVTGTDCRTEASANSTTISYPIPPIDLNLPEKIPLVFYVLFLNDPMSECAEPEVENGLKHTMLGLGDVVMPGFLVAYCFYVDVMKKNRFYCFGLVSLSGYSIGMIVTFFALRLMKTAQPALIYLVPFTLLPVFAYTWRKGITRQVWLGGKELSRP